MSQIPFAFQWSISENQLLLLKNSRGFVASDSFLNIPGFKCFFKIFPFGNTWGFRNYTRIIVCCSFNMKITAEYVVTIESANYSKTTRHLNGRINGETYTCISNINTDEFFDPEKKYIVDGKITLSVYGIFKFGLNDTLVGAVDQQEQNWNGGELGDDFWKTNDTKDVNIIADGKEIKAHKCVLVTRSVFFKDILNVCMNEQNVEITDFPFKVVEAALKMIYNCNFTSDLTVDELAELLRFFDKYLFPDFKAKVEPLLIAQISTTTVCRLTNASLLSNSPMLHQQCFDFLIVCFASKTPLSDLEILDKNVALRILQNSLTP